MRNPLYNDELEDFLQQQADQHRMYPSDQLWRNIQTSLHGERRWPALTFISIFIIVALVIGTLVVEPGKHISKVDVTTESTRVSASSSPKQNKVAQEVLAEHLSPEHITQETMKALTGSSSEKVEANTRINTASITVPAVTTNVVDVLLASNAAVTNARQDVPNESPAKTEKGLTERIAITAIKLPETGAPQRLTTLKAFDKLTAQQDDIWRDYPIIPNSIIKAKLSKFTFQFYLTPSVSYRRLVSAKSFDNAQFPQSYLDVPVAANYAIDVNKVVRHRPAVGSEVGVALGYRLTNRITLKAGVQFNMRQYNIEAYSYKPVQSSSAEALVQNGFVDSFATVNNYNAISTTQNSLTESTPITLQNTYYELSAPVGIDYRILTTNKLSWNVAAAVQPTYTFDKEPFTITSNYKGYTDGSALMRNWNINTSIETYLSYQLGKFRWQLGPQFRYQQLPTLAQKYPVREYLLDYGIKFGFTKAIN